MYQIIEIPLHSDPPCLFLRSTRISFAGLKAALQAAKTNVERHYAAVGFLSDIDSFVKVLEALLPDFFEGAGKLKPSAKVANKGKNKTRLSEEARRALAEQLAPEYELVEFLRRRFERQKRALGITRISSPL